MLMILFNEKKKMKQKEKRVKTHPLTSTHTNALIKDFVCFVVQIVVVL